MHSPDTTLSLEEMLRLGARNLESLIDENGRTYFDVFLTNPAEAVTDWPDFVDLPSRYWEALAMADPVFNRDPEITKRIRRWLFSHFETDGLAYRPESPISAHTPEMFDQSRLLYALVTWAMFDPSDAEVRQRTVAIIDTLIGKATFQNNYAFIDRIGLYFGGTLVRPILQAGLVFGRQDWIDFAGSLSRGLFSNTDLIGEDGSFKDHVHGALSAIAGAISYAVVAGDPVLLNRARKGFDYARSISTSFGFVPEVAQRDDDLIACETCTLMDYLDAALLLARHIDPSYWDIIEKAARNHLWESQVRDATWLDTSPEAQDEPGIIRTNLQKRVIGSFAGWSAPHCILAYDEYLHPGWVRTEAKRPIYLNKVRALQNCCAGGGVRAVHQVWSNIVTREGDLLSINLSLDKATEEIDVTSFLPFAGEIVIKVKIASSIRWRIPAQCEWKDVQVNGCPVQVTQVQNGFIYLGFVPIGAEIKIHFPVPTHSESISIGNEGFQQYHFDVEWRGDTVMAMVPDRANASVGFSRVMKCEVPTSYADHGTGPIYQRKNWPQTHAGIATAITVVDHCKIDWYSLRYTR